MNVCCEKAPVGKISKALGDITESEETFVPEGHVLGSVPNICGYYMDLTSWYPEVRHTIRFDTVLAPGAYKIMDLEKSTELTHMHVRQHTVCPRDNIEGYAEIFTFKPHKTYCFAVETASLLGPGMYSVHSEDTGDEAVMMIDWGWRRVLPSQQILA